jgi:hypothetical protein
MSTESLGDRGKALEGKFFHEREQQQIARLREQKAREAAVDELADIVGVKDEALLSRMVELGVTPMTLVAFNVVPMLHVAWSDRQLDEQERKSILLEATDMGVKSTSPAYALMESWLSERPRPELFEAWKAYHAELRQHLSAAERQELRRTTLERAETVARASGGLLGIGSVSGDERAALQELDRILSD